MAGDITIRTSLLEHRLVAGSRALYRALPARRSRRRLDARHFYEAKLLEQQQRHLKYHDTAYNLEPNVKESPGGLRDLQTVLWIARAAGLGRTWRELAKAGLITAQEARTVSRQERFIGALRVRLHYLAGRREDRLVFDLQSALARELGLVDTPAKARQRAADAALLPRGQARPAGQRDPAAEPARAAVPGRRPSRSPSTTSSSRSTSSSISGTRRCSSAGRRRCSMRS